MLGERKQSTRMAMGGERSELAAERSASPTADAQEHSESTHYAVHEPVSMVLSKLERRLPVGCLTNFAGFPSRPGLREANRFAGHASACEARSTSGVALRYVHPDTRRRALPTQALLLAYLTRLAGATSPSGASPPVVASLYALEPGRAGPALLIAPDLASTGGNRIPAVVVCHRLCRDFSWTLCV